MPTQKDLPVSRTEPDGSAPGRRRRAEVTDAWVNSPAGEKRPAETEIPNEQLQVLAPAAERVVAFAKDELGRRLERGGHVDERAGRLDLRGMEEAERRLCRSVLFSCLVLERTLGISAPAAEFPKVIAAATEALLEEIAPKPTAEEERH